MKESNFKQPSQDDSEAKAFIYAYIKQIAPEIADQYRQEAFIQSQSQQNLEHTLSILPPNFIETLISDKEPKTNNPSLIYNPQPFDNSQINQFHINSDILQSMERLARFLQYRIPKKRRIELEYKYISKILLTHRVIGHTRLVRLIIHDPARQYFLTVSSDRTMKLWHLPSLTLMYTFKGHEDDVITADISSDRTLIASISSDQSIRIWSLITGCCLEKIVNSDLWPFNNVTFSPCGRYLAISSEQGRIVVRCTSGIDHINFLYRPTNFPILKTFLLRDPVRYCCFSPGGRLIAAALHSGDLAVFTLFDTKLWYTNVSDTHCDFCFFHPFNPSQVFAVSSKSGIADMYEIGDDLKLIHSFNAKKTFKRMTSCLFALSCDASLMFACSLSQMITWSVGDGRMISKIENLPTACEVSPHPHLPTVVAVVCKSVVLIIDTETNRIINSMYIPDSAFKMDSGNWCENGLDFTAADTIGGVYFFKQGLRSAPVPSMNLPPSDQQNENENENENPETVNVSRFNNNANISLNAPRNIGTDGITQTCISSCFFFPNDFTDSYWDENKGEVEESNAQPINMNRRDAILNERGELLIENYRPHGFKDIFFPYVPHSSISVLHDFEEKWIPTLKPTETIEVENELLELSEEQSMLNAMINVDSRNADMMMSNSSSNEDEEKNEDSLCPTNRYPFWTLIDSANHNSFFPQISDRIVYIRQGHLEMLKDELPMLTGEKSNIKPSIDNEELWPPIAAFEICEVTHGKFSCVINMKRLQLNENISFLANMKNVDDLEICDTEPIRTLDYPIGNATAFLILADQYAVTVDCFEKKMKNGDDVEVFFKKGDSEKKYTGKVLEKIDSSPEDFTYYNSISMDWGDDFGDDGLYSPWEIYSVNQKVVYTPLISKRDPILQSCAKGVEKVLEFAQKRVRSLRPFFKQPFFVRGIVYPSDFGLIKRRLSNNMYRNIISLQFDIKNVLDTQLYLPGHSSMDICYVQLLIERLNEVIKNMPEMSLEEQTSFIDEMCDFSHFEEDAEEMHEENERKKLDKEREMRSKKRSYNYKRRDSTINYKDDDDDIEFDSDSERRRKSYSRNRYFTESDEKRRKKRSSYEEDIDDEEFKQRSSDDFNEDDGDMNYEDVVKRNESQQRSRRMNSSGSSANRSALSAANKKKKKTRKRVKVKNDNGEDFVVDEEEDYYEYYNDEDEDGDFVMQDDDAEVEDVSKVVKTLKASRRERPDQFREKEASGGGSSRRYKRSSYKGSDNSSFEEGSYDDDF